MDFKEFVKNKRLESGIGLREFCEKVHVDPSNWSKVERGILPLSYEKKKLEQIASALNIEKGSYEWREYFDLVYLSQQKIPDDIMEKEDDLKKSFNKIRDDVRISVPHIKVDKFKNVLLYILERCAGKPNVGETVLYKLLYFADFNYYELYEEQLTGASYKKLPRGPVPYKIDTIL